MSLERPLFLVSFQFLLLLTLHSNRVLTSALRGQVINPGLEDASKPPPPLHLKFEGSLDEIGPYSCAMDSQFLMVRSGFSILRVKLN